MDNETPVTMYSTTWCGHCLRLKRQMEEAGIPHRVIDVDEEPGYDERIIAAAGGYRVVPTLEVGGRLLVNPTLRELEAVLAA